MSGLFKKKSYFLIHFTCKDEKLGYIGSAKYLDQNENNHNLSCFHFSPSPVQFKVR